MDLKALLKYRVVAVVVIHAVLVAAAWYAAWWLALSFGVSLLRERINPELMLWVNRISGFIILAFGIYSLSSIFFQN